LNFKRNIIFLTVKARPVIRQNFSTFTFCTFHHNAGQASIAVQVDSGASK